MNKTNTPFRYDYVGSFLRPAALKQARADFQSGRIDAAALKAVEDDAIRDLVAKQKAAGYHVITDGEFRRATWHLDFMWGFHGVGHTPTKTGLPFQGEAAMLDDTYLTGKVSVDEHPFVEHFRFVKALEDENTVAKLTIPAPAQFLEQMVMPFAMENTKRFYPSVQELMDDLAAGYRKVIADVYAAGCRNLQFDDCSWGMLVDPRACMIFDTDAKGLEEIKEQMLTVNNMAIGGKPDDLVINTHVCRGNFHSTYASSGAYDSVAKTLLARENVNAYYLEFDDARSGGFEPEPRGQIAAVSLAQALPEAVRSAVCAVLTVSGFVVTFSVVTGMLDASGLLPALVGTLSARLGLELHFARALCTGVLELGTGIGAMQGLTPTPANLALAAFLIGWGGVSVHCQTAAVLAGTDIKSARHTAGRLLHGALSALCMWVLANLF